MAASSISCIAECWIAIPPEAKAKNQVLDNEQIVTIIHLG